ncbi:hypothetical protein GF386_02380 [Candidatus Pacearchaeota archaeon]|nr:hypothetical protein [Candidatus Pacearchaeota archaeon]
MMEEDILEEGYKRALEVLYKNSTSKGFSASPEHYANYYSIWARDHAICSIAVCLSNDGELIETAKNGIFFLLHKQIDYGQVPSYVEIESKNRVYGGHGAITSVDSNMWVIIAAAELYRKTKDIRFLSDVNIKRYNRLYSLLKALDSNNCGLMEVPVTGDWADIFNRSYHVLYDECLYYQALKDLLFLFQERLKRKRKHEKFGINNYIFKRIKWLKKRRTKVKRRINELMWFTKDNIEKVRQEYMIVSEIKVKNYEYYQSFLMPFKNYWSQRFDSFGNIMAIITEVADKKNRNTIINYVLKNNINKPFPITALHPPVFKNNKDWEPIYSTKEKPYTYHNGGIWPMVGGFWIHVLSKVYPEKAKEDLEILAKALKEDNWMFNEQHSGKTGKPLGRNFQAWSAAGFIIGYFSVKHRINLFI